MNKRLLRRLAERYLPTEVARKPKFGFGIPLDSWLGQNGRQSLREALGSTQAGLNQLVRPEWVKHLLDGFVTGQFDRSQRSRYGLYQSAYFLWGLERWLNRWHPTI